MRALLIATILAAVTTPALAIPHGLVEPHMHIASGGATPQVALTLDACEGGVDLRILDALIRNSIPATIFATGRWIAGNAPAVLLLRSHPDLFEVEDHGLMHIPAVIGTIRPYGLKPAGSASAVMAEVNGGAAAITTAFGTTPLWYRDATALYSPDALSLIRSHGYRIGGFSLNGDFGATSPAAAVERRIAAAKDGDVILSHVNQPLRDSGTGVVAGVLDLRARGFRFVRLEDVPELPD